MTDHDLPPPNIEAAAKLLDPDAWASSDSQGEAFHFRYRRYEAREKAGWPNEHWPRPMPMMRRARSA